MAAVAAVEEPTENLGTEIQGVGVQLPCSHHPDASASYLPFPEFPPSLPPQVSHQFHQPLTMPQFRVGRVGFVRSWLEDAREIFAEAQGGQGMGFEGEMRLALRNGGEEVGGDFR